MTRRTLGRSAFPATCLVFVLSASVACAQQFFSKDPLGGIANTQYYGSFMQHHPGWTAQQFYGGLHDGIDIGATPGDTVFCPIDNDGETFAIVGFISAAPRGKLLLVKPDCYETEALLLGHIDPEPWEFEDWVYGSDSLGVLDYREHLHAALYQDFEYTTVFSGCHTDLKPELEFEDPINNDDLKESLVNPAHYAFEEATWLSDDGDFDPQCKPKARLEVHYDADYPGEPSYVAVVTASDKNESILSSDCRTGIYEMVFYADDDWRDAIWLGRFWNRDGTGTPTAADYYYYPDDPPDSCNQADPPYGNLKYYLVWATQDTSQHHFEVVVRDVAGNERTVVSSDHITADGPQVNLVCRLDGSRILVSWNRPEDWNVTGFNLYRARLDGGLRELVNRVPIAATDEAGNPILEFEYSDGQPSGMDWDVLGYSLDGIRPDGKAVQVGRGSVRNPLWASGEIRVSPNPFSKTVRVAFANRSDGDVAVRVYDVRGRLVTEIENARLPGGVVTYEWDGKETNGRLVSPGVYFVAVNRGDETRVAKVALVR